MLTEHGRRRTVVAALASQWQIASSSRPKLLIFNTDDLSGRGAVPLQPNSCAHDVPSVHAGIGVPYLPLEDRVDGNLDDNSDRVVCGYALIPSSAAAATTDSSSSSNATVGVHAEVGWAKQKKIVEGEQEKEAATAAAPAVEAATAAAPASAVPTAAQKAAAPCEQDAAAAAGEQGAVAAAAEDDSETATGTSAPVRESPVASVGSQSFSQSSAPRIVLPPALPSNSAARGGGSLPGCVTRSCADAPCAAVGMVLRNGARGKAGPPSSGVSAHSESSTCVHKVVADPKNLARAPPMKEIRAASGRERAGADVQTEAKKKTTKRPSSISVDVQLEDTESQVTKKKSKKKTKKRSSSTNDIEGSGSQVTKKKSKKTKSKKKRSLQDLQFIAPADWSFVGVRRKIYYNASFCRELEQRMSDVDWRTELQSVFPVVCDRSRNGEQTQIRGRQFVRWSGGHIFQTCDGEFMAEIYELLTVEPKKSVFDLLQL